MRTFRTSLAILFVLVVSAVWAQDAFRVMDIEVFDADDKPLEDATIAVETADWDFPLYVNKEGIATLNFPADAAQVTLRASCPDYVPLEVRWMRENIPAQYRFSMTRGEPIGGIVRDERGRPIEGVKVEGLAVSSRVTQEGTSTPVIGGELGTTDAQGRWRAEVATAESLELRLKLTHEKYFSDSSFGKRRISNEDLRSLKHVEVLEDHISPQGTICNELSKPVANASFYVLAAGESVTLENGIPRRGHIVGKAEGVPPEPICVSDATGHFEFARPANDFTLLCLADEGWQIVRGREFSKNVPVDIALNAWARVEGVLTQEEKPVAEERLQLLVHNSQWRDGDTLVTWTNYATTNEKGEFEFERLTNGHAILGKRIEYCEGTEFQRQEFSNEFQTSLTAGADVKLACSREGNAVSGIVVPLLFDGREATVSCGIIVLTKNDAVLDFFNEVFFEIGKESTMGIQFDPRATNVVIDDRPKPYYVGRIDAKGAFHIEHVPPGSYTARATLWCEQLEDEPTGWHRGSIWESFPVVPQGAKKSVDLGLLEFEVFAAGEE